MIIQDYDGLEALSNAAAGLFTELSLQAIKEKGFFTVFLSGGNTPLETYRVLAEEPYRDKVQWDRISVFWGDERYVSAESEQNNSHMAFATLLNHVPIPPENIHPIPTSLSPERSSSLYEELLLEFMEKHPYPADLIFLGLGNNAHTASLFPYSPVLKEAKRWVKDVYIPELKMYRITLTAPFINKAKNIAFLISGKDKMHVFKEVTEGPYDPERLPAQLIKPIDGSLYWLVDKKASR